MAVYRLSPTVFTPLALLFALSAISQPAEAADGPNRITHSDVAAGQWVDSLLAPEIVQKPKRNGYSQHPRSRMNQRRAALRGRLVKNPNTEDGTSPFVLVDPRGRVLRYVEPTKQIDLESFLGETVSVRRDTGKILLASQLALPAGGGIRLTQSEEPIPTGEELDEASILTDSVEHSEGPVFEEGGPLYLEEGIDFGGCPDCGYGVSGCGQGCGFGTRGVLYVRGEYLSWWMDGMDTPPLVIADDNAAFTSPDIIYGGSPILEDSRDGGRFTIGLWLDDYGKWGIEAEYLGLQTLTEVFQAGGNDGAPGPSGLFIGRPFFNTLEFTDGNGIVVPRGPAREDVDTQRLDGVVTVTSRSEFDSFSLRLRHNLCCAEPCCVGCGSGVSCGTGCGSGCGCGVGGSMLPGPLGRVCRLLKSGVRRTDMLYGIRYTRLKESLHVNEDLLVVEAPAAPAADDTGTTFIVNDMFNTENEFTGFDLGFVNEWERNRWSVTLLSKIALGNTNQRVAINGNTTIDDGGGPQEFVGGLLAQRYEGVGVVAGNIGTYERDEFSVIPELSVNVGYQLTPRIKLVGGYTLLYWSNVLRPGNQIDIDVNGTFIPSGAATPDGVNGDHPRFVFVQDDLWIQGINVGAEVGW